VKAHCRLAGIRWMQNAECWLAGKTSTLRVKHNSKSIIIVQLPAEPTEPSQAWLWPDPNSCCRPSRRLRLGLGFGLGFRMGTAVGAAVGAGTPAGSMEHENCSV